MKESVIIELRLCEPHRPPQRGQQAALCPGRECGRVAFRSIGDDPNVLCECGAEFNVNYSYLGNVEGVVE